MKKNRRVMVLGGSQMDRLIAGVFDYAKANANWRVQASTISPTDPASVVRWHKIEGVIVSTPGAGVAEAMAEATPHVVVVNPDAPPDTLPSVHIDDYAVGRCAAEHLIEYGHRHFGFFGWESTWTRDRLRGFEEALEEAGFACQTMQTTRGALPTLRTVDSGNNRMVSAWLKSLPRPAGVMINHDGVAFNFMEHCEAIGRRVPDDIAVVGVDNSELTCLSTRPTLSSVDTNHEEVGFRAAGMLDRMLAGERVDRGVAVIPPRGVIIRQSTDRHMFDDEEVNTALQFIRENADEPISVEDVLDRVRISRSSLESRFRKYLGHTPGAEIRRVRLEHARKLLLESNMTLIEIGVRCGFSSLSYLSQAFKRAYGVSPHHYRLRYKRR